MWLIPLRIFPRANVTANAVTNAPANYYFWSICHCEILRDFAIGRLPQICKVTIVDSGLFDHGESKYAVFVVQLYTLAELEKSRTLAIRIAVAKPRAINSICSAFAQRTFIIYLFGSKCKILPSTGGSQTPPPTNDDALNSAGINSAPFFKIACTTSMFIKEKNN